MAKHDLYFGPNQWDDEPASYPGFVAACKNIAEELSELDALYVDNDNNEVFPFSPAETDDEHYERCHFSRREALRITFGELAEYLQ